MEYGVNGASGQFAPTEYSKTPTDAKEQGWAEGDAAMYTSPREASPGRRHKKKRGQQRWRFNVYDFCQGTTLHGLKQVSEHQPFVLRRLFWMVLVLMGIGIFLYQLVQGVIYFYSWPVSVNVQINYNDSLIFPAITICNQNAFRSTLAAERGQYQLLTGLFSNSSHSSHVNLDLYDAQNLTLLDIYNNTAHKPDDFIVSCTWDGRPCGPLSVNPTFTDFGRCVTFNDGSDGVIRFASKTGAEGGLRLLLNIEQYEYMPGPNEGAGVKMLAHPQGEFTSVRDLGVAVPPGSHGFVAIKAIEVTNLPRPHGKCNDSVKLQYYKHYSNQKCVAECKQISMQDQCSCRDIYMPPGETDFPDCNLTSFQDCMRQARAVKHNVRALPQVVTPGPTYTAELTCVCPVSCASVLYEKMVSYAYISDYDTIGLLNSDLTPKLQKRYVKAREVTQRVQNTIVNKDTDMISKFKNSIDDIDRIILSVSVMITDIEAFLDEDMVEMNKRLIFHLDRGLEGVEYIFAHDFVRGWTVKKERVLDYVCFNFYEVVDSMNRLIDNMNHTSSPDVKESLFLNMDNILNNRRLKGLHASDNITQTNNSYTTGEPLLTWKFTIDRRYDMSYISLPLLHNDIKGQANIFRELIMDLNEYLDSINALSNLTNDFVHNGTMDKGELLVQQNAFLKACKGYNYNVFRFGSRVVKAPEAVVLTILDEFKRKNRTLYEARSNVIRTGQMVREMVSPRHNSKWLTIKSAAQAAENYLRNPASNKTEVAKYFASIEVQNAFQEMSLFFANLRSRGRDLNDKITSFNIAMQDMWTNMLSESTTKGLYQMIHVDFEDYVVNKTSMMDKYIRIFASMLRTRRSSITGIEDRIMQYRLNADFVTTDLATKLGDIDEKYSNLNRASDINAALGNADNVFTVAFTVLQNSLFDFLDLSIVNSAFYVNNFIRLDAFMQELSYEAIIQQEAYDIFNLLGDIGGSLGLFIGASVLSIIEVLDFVVHQSIRGIFRR